MGKKFIVEYDKPACIGAFACVAVCPEHWEVGEDGKATLKNARKEGEKYLLEFDEADFKKMMDSAESCPVTVIHIIDPDGKKLI